MKIIKLPLYIQQCFIYQSHREAFKILDNYEEQLRIAFSKIDESEFISFEDSEKMEINHLSEYYNPSVYKEHSPTYYKVEDYPQYTYDYAMYRVGLILQQVYSEFASEAEEMAVEMNCIDWMDCYCDKMYLIN